ncbi:hypothetical protein [Curtobacterium sp. MCPF17_031]|uniref:hypothetical protein n=1 Tax=Curtobacterium sp. MCPF17_031 TaxID=2175653 RepID=UPI000DAA7F13|nr:hypothetical protein [Curtobacterium sp. MCPF17_031]PZE39735.1 hypothetical protein DEJ31_02665 [Curtobacterium sp. MCPF17_031]
MDEFTRQLIQREASSLSPSLFGCLDEAVASAAGLPYPRDRFPHAHAMHVRAVFRGALEHEELPEGWTVTGNTRSTGQTFLTNVQYGTTLRLLSESRVTMNGVPHAGTSRARRAQWAQFAFFGAEEVARRHRDLLLLMDTRAEEPSLRIVHPIEEGKYKGKVACDFLVSMIREFDDVGNAVFDTEEEHLDFFANVEGEDEAGLGDV